MRPSSIQTDWLSSSAFSLDWSVSVSAWPLHHSLSKQSEITWTAPLQHSSSSLSKICLLSSQENPVYVPIKCFNLARKYLTLHNVILLKTCIFLVCVSVFSKVHTDLLSATRTRLSSPDDAGWRHQTVQSISSFTSQRLWPDAHCSQFGGVRMNQTGTKTHLLFWIWIKWSTEQVWTRPRERSLLTVHSRKLLTLWYQQFCYFL